MSTKLKIITLNKLVKELGEFLDKKIDENITGKITLALLYDENIIYDTMKDTIPNYKESIINCDEKELFKSKDIPNDIMSDIKRHWSVLSLEDKAIVFKYLIKICKLF